MAYVDPESKKTYIMEAHIEVGNIARPLDEYLKDGNMRVAIFRWNDSQNPDLPHKAAAYMYQMITEASAKGENIHYNFSLDLDKRPDLFCSQLPYRGFLDTSDKDKKVDLGYYKTTITPKNGDFVKRLGITVKKSFVPIDLEVESRFDLVAEWRDLSRVRESHMKDAMLDAFYRWSNEKNYILHETPMTCIGRHI
ncbi:MAG: hypothetical protein WCG27_01360, partial [Pseudomonadota bacterium]